MNNIRHAVISLADVCASALALSPPALSARVPVAMSRMAGTAFGS